MRRHESIGDLEIILTPVIRSGVAKEDHPFSSVYSRLEKGDDFVEMSGDEHMIRLDPMHALPNYCTEGDVVYAFVTGYESFAFGLRDDPPADIFTSTGKVSVYKLVKELVREIADYDEG